jgi:hypothetical protein
MLEGKFPIQRAPMSLKLSFPAAAKEEVHTSIWHNVSIKWF